MTERDHDWFRKGLESAANEVESWPEQKKRAMLVAGYRGKEMLQKINVKKLLQNITSLETLLYHYFDGIVKDLLVDMTDNYWTINGKPVGFSEENPNENPDIPEDEVPEHVYSEDIRTIVRKKDFTLIKIRTCTGDGLEDLIFDNSKEIKLRD